MKTPRNVYGTDLAKHLCKHWEFQQSHYTGSHIMLDTKTPFPRRTSVPAHRPVAIGTLNSILDDVAKHKNVTREDLLRDL